MGRSYTFTTQSMHAAVRFSAPAIFGVVLGSLVSPLSSWAQGPLIYGYLSYFPSQPAATSSNEVAWLNRYHVNYVQFYDWQWKHHWPLAGSVTNPATSWNDIANRTNYRQTVNDFIDACRALGMKAMAYNLLYGAFADYLSDGSGVSGQWGLYNSAGGSQWSVAMPGGWATSALVMFNPSNTLWQSYLFSRENEMFSVYAFDGWHVDQLGDPGGLKYDAGGHTVDVWQTFVSFLNAARSTTGKRLIFNNVGTYGMFSVCNQTADDGVYVECWEANGQTTYNDLKTVIDDGLAWGNGKPVVLAAYVNRGKTSGNFNSAGVLLCDAVIFANGGTHIELGDGGHMLCNEYFPNRTLSLTPGLADTLTNYYDFIVNYKTWLYGGLTNSTNTISLSVPANSIAAPNAVWAFAKVNAGAHMLNLINLIGESSINWRDNTGTYPLPTAQTNVAVKYYCGTANIGSVQLASPDLNGGAFSELTFTTGTDAGGSYVAFTLPSLHYWDLLMLRKPGPALFAPAMSGTNFQFSFLSEAGQGYTVWSSTDLVGKWAVQTNFISSQVTQQVVLPVPAGALRNYYRVTEP